MKLVINDASFLQVYIDTLHVGMKIVHCGYIYIYIYIYTYIFFLIEGKNVSYLNNIIISLYL